MPSSRQSSHRSSSSTTSSTSSNYSGGSRNTYSTTMTSYSESQRRPSVKHHDTCPGRFGGRVVEEPSSYDETIDPRSSVETYASTVASDEDLADQPEYELPNDRHKVYETDAIPTTPSDFAKLFPTTRRLLIQHDDSTSDGNMNLRVDTEAVSTRGEKLKMTLFHLRMKNLYERQFSLRRYCRDSGREVCHSKKKYAKPIQKSQQRKKPSLQRSFTSALQNLGKKSYKHQPHREDSGYESDEDAEQLEEELRAFTLSSEVKATIPTNTVRLEFSNYAQVEVHRCRQHRTKKYDFEYWGEPYTWQREFSLDGDDQVYSYELINVRTGECIAYIMPDKLDERQARLEASEGGWIPPSSMRITESVSEDLGDVIIATGLVALSDDCIKRRWHSAHSTRVDVPSPSSKKFIPPEQVVDHVFRRPGSAKAHL